MSVGPASGAYSGPVCWRQSKQSRIGWGCGAVGFLALGALIGSIPGLGNHLGGAAVATIGAFTCWRVGFVTYLRLDDSEVTVQNLFRKTTILRSDLRGAGSGSYGIYLRRHSGRSVCASAVPKANISFMLRRVARADEVVAQIRDYIVTA